MDREQVFDEDYLYFYESFLTDEASDGHVDLVWRLLELEATSSSTTMKARCSLHRAGG